MVTTVCLNPAIDQSAKVDRLQVGEVNRLRDTRAVIGGKGINVAIVLRRLHAEVHCIGFVGETDIPFFRQGMEREGAAFHAVAVSGSVRRNLKIIDSGSHTVTEFNEQGAEANVAALSRLAGLLNAQTGSSRYTALCGSLPPGCGSDTYQTMMREIPDNRWIVDTSGGALQYALKEKPFLIKPNLAELEELVGEKMTTLNAVQNAAEMICAAGAAHVAVSMGAKGAILTNGTRTVFAPAVPVDAAFAVGAGDAMLAGLLFGLEQGETVFESLQYGIAAGAACVQGGGIHSFSESEFTALLPKVRIQEL